MVVGIEWKWMFLQSNLLYVPHPQFAGYAELATRRSGIRENLMSKDYEWPYEEAARISFFLIHNL